MKRARPFLFLMCLYPASAQVVTYETHVFPEAAGWERAGSGQAERSLQEGFFVQFVEIPGVLDAYRHSLVDFAGEEHLFIEWRVETDAPSSILDASGTPVVLSAYGTGLGNYHFTITDERVRVIRSNFLPIVFADIEPGLLHTYRLELFGEDVYAWYLDGQLMDWGVPAGPYPTTTSGLIWGVREYDPGHTTRWDYVRYGTIPEDASGDYDSDGRIDVFDFYFLAECLLGPGGDGGHGCPFADMDHDDDVDLHDFALFQNAFTGAE